MISQEKGALMKKTLTTIILICFITRLAAAGEQDLSAATGKFDFAKPIKNKTSLYVPNDKHLNVYKTAYIDKAKKYQSEGNYIQACAVIQKLVDILVKKSSEITMEEWLASYNRFYQQVLTEQNAYKAQLEAHRTGTLKKAFEKAQKERLSTIKGALSNKKDIALKGSLSVDQTVYILSSAASSNSIAISAFSLAGEKLYDDIVIPDDTNNPQIKRWSKTYRSTFPKWSPDGSKYAYILNGALCVSDRDGKSFLISNISDSAEENDISYEWSLNGKKLCYLRQNQGNITAYANSASGGEEIKLGPAEEASISGDGSRVLCSFNGKIKLYNSVSGQGSLFASGTKATFSTDGAQVIYIANGLVKIRNVDSKEENVLYKIPQGRKVVSLAGLALNAAACVFSNGDVIIIYSDGKSAQISKNAGAIDKSFLNSPSGILCTNKLITLTVKE